MKSEGKKDRNPIFYFFLSNFDSQEMRNSTKNYISLRITILKRDCIKSSLID